MASIALDDVFEANRRFLWGLCYRMTGCAADADDLVQETFVRAMEHPPARQDEPWRPWLVRVALNLSRDVLRRRKRSAYVGPWLPSPVPTGDDASPLSFEVSAAGASTEARYDLMETVSFAFLLALEALTPRQRAVLILRDVFDYTVRETADALALSEPNVKTTHHRARQAMAAYEREHRRAMPGSRSRVTQVLEQFLNHLAAHDVAAIERLLADDARVITDGGGEFVAALQIIEGASSVARFLLGIAGRAGDGARMSFRNLNAWPAAVIELPQAGPGYPPRLVFRFDLDGDARVTAVHIVAASRKMTAVAPVPV